MLDWLLNVLTYLLPVAITWVVLEIVKMILKAFCGQAIERYVDAAKSHGLNLTLIYTSRQKRRRIAELEKRIKSVELLTISPSASVGYVGSVFCMFSMIAIVNFFWILATCYNPEMREIDSMLGLVNPTMNAMSKVMRIVMMVSGTIANLGYFYRVSHRLEVIEGLITPERSVAKWRAEVTSLKAKIAASTAAPSNSTPGP